MSPEFTDDDIGKRVVNAEGEEVGLVADVEHGTAHVEPDPGITDTIKAKLGWGGADDDTYPLQNQAVAGVTDDEVRLQSDLSGAGSSGGTTVTDTNTTGTTETGTTGTGATDTDVGTDTGTDTGMTDTEPGATDTDTGTDTGMTDTEPGATDTDVGTDTGSDTGTDRNRGIDRDENDISGNDDEGLIRDDEDDELIGDDDDDEDLIRDDDDDELIGDDNDTGR